MAQAARKPTTRANSVTLVKALACWLPCCDNVFDIAVRLNLLLQRGKIFLFGDGVKIPPASIQNGMVGIVAFDTPKPHLEVQVTGGWSPRWTRSLDQMEWTFERTTFVASLPTATKQAPPREPTGWQADLVLRWLRKTYPPDGKTPRSKTYKALRAEMAKDPDVIAEIERTGRSIPSEDVIGRVVRYLGRSN